MAERFYVNCSLTSGPLLLQGAEAHHLAHVCRVHAGDHVSLFNGDGYAYAAEVTEVRKREVEVRILERTAPGRELDFVLIVAAPVPKGDRAQFLVEKLTELGVHTYVPLRTRRSVVHPREARHDRFERYVVEASKQCGRNTLMQIEPMADWDEFQKRDGLPRERWLANVGAPVQRLEPQDLVCAVGPEGGFSAEEVEQAQAFGWKPLGLGPRVLRIETAALALAALMSCSPH